MIELYEDKREDILKRILNVDLVALRKEFQKNGFDIRIVGGAVRDILNNKSPKDIDLCTDASPDEQIKIYESAGFLDGDKRENQDKHANKFVRTGIQHGTITAIINREPYEITSLRTETNHDGRHAEVAYTRDWIEDLSRRDLTVNAMALSFDGDLIDPFHGEEDLKNGMVRFVGNAEERMKEDYLRILRFFRFHGRISNGRYDDATEHAIKVAAPGLKQISGERIWMEMSKILVGRLAGTEVEKMYQLGVAQVIGLPISGASKARQIDTLNGKVKSPITILALLIDDIMVAQKLNDHWKFSNPEFKLLTFLVGSKKEYSNMNLETAQDMVVDGIPTSFVNELSTLVGKDFIAKQIINWKAPIFPINGADMQSIGVKPGPQMGVMLKTLKNKWKKSRYKLSKDELLSMINTDE
jgi:tRNA nucleotidyltransferase (CCA-adding enzyme)